MLSALARHAAHLSNLYWAGGACFPPLADQPQPTRARPSLACGTEGRLVRFPAMEEAARYRDFANRCRELAETAHETTARTLLALARDFDERADGLEKHQGEE